MAISTKNTDHVIKWVTIIAIPLMIVGIIVMIYACMQESGHSSGIVSEEPEYQLQLLSFRSEHCSSSHMCVMGEVKNINHNKLDRVMANVSWYTNDGIFITSDDALIDYNPIMPNQTSPFEVISTLFSQLGVLIFKSKPYNVPHWLYPPARD